jgi:hypothetical protein
LRKQNRRRGKPPPTGLKFRRFGHSSARYPRKDGRLPPIWAAKNPAYFIGNDCRQKRQKGDHFALPKNDNSYLFNELGGCSGWHES